jgi:uncharacterized surface protein with fasciclin (FAS1) repeats
MHHSLFISLQPSSFINITTNLEEPKDNAVISTSFRVVMIIISLLSVLQGYVAHGFAPAVGGGNTVTVTAAAAAITSSSCVGTTTTTLHRRRRRHSIVSRSSATKLYSNSREQVENFLSESYPKFCSLLQQNPSALQQMRESEVGFAVFALTDAAFALMPQQLQLLEAACNEPRLQEVVSTMAAYHMISVPISGDVMASFQVVTTRVGELPVEVASDGSGALYVNGVRILQSYVFEDVIIQNYQDKDGNMIGSQAGAGGKRYIVHEVESLICPNELWQSLHSHFQSSLF